MKTNHIIRIGVFIPAISLMFFCSPLKAAIGGLYGSIHAKGCPYCNGSIAPPDGFRDPSLNSGTNPAADPVPESSLARLKRLAAEAQAAAQKPQPPTPKAPSTMVAPVAAVSAPAVPAPRVNPAGAGQQAPFPEIKQGSDGFLRVSFEHLASFPFTPPPENDPPKAGSVEGIPANVRALDGKRIAVTGFMLPVKMEKGLATEFLLIRNPMMCCYGVTPATNEWVLVKMKGKGVAATMDVPLNFYGTLHVGAVIEEKMFAGLYELDGEKISVQ